MRLADDARVWAVVFGLVAMLTVSAAARAQEPVLPSIACASEATADLELVCLLRPVADAQVEPSVNLMAEFVAAAGPTALIVLTAAVGLRIGLGAGRV